MCDLQITCYAADSDPHLDLLSHASISIVPISQSPATLKTENRYLFVILAPLKVLWQVWQLWLVLAYRTKPAQWLLVQVCILILSFAGNMFCYGLGIRATCCFDHVKSTCSEGLCEAIVLSRMSCMIRPKEHCQSVISSNSCGLIARSGHRTRRQYPHWQSRYLSASCGIPSLLSIGITMAGPS